VSTPPGDDARHPGEVAFVLHTHLPYVRRHGVWPVGEEWLFQAWGESWLPVTSVLLRLAEDGHRDVLTLGVTPMVAHQVADQRLVRELGTWLAGRMWLSEEQRTRYAGRDRAAIRALASFHWRRYASLLELHEQVEAAGGLPAVWADLASRGVIELLGGPATHPYLPLVDDPDLLEAQLRSGLEAHARWAGRPARGLWAPECGYRPAGPVADPTAEPELVDRHGTPVLPCHGPDLPGLERWYAELGVTHTVVDAATLVRAAGGADRDWTRRPTSPDPAAGSADEVVHDGVLVGDSDVAAYARDLAVAYHVWSPQSGYPGDPWYRDFHTEGGFGVLPSWRVTDKSVPPERKAPYEPDRASERAAAHASHFHGVLRTTLGSRPGALVVAAYDTELFGHWWSEGPNWLEHLLRRVAADPGLRTTTLASRRERCPPTRRLDLPESSWGYAKGHASWVTPQTRPMWSWLRGAEERFRRALRGSGGDPLVDAALDQAARELAQAQASDWPFMVTRGECAGYARERLAGHVAAVHQFVDAAEAAREDGDRTELAASIGDRRDRVDAPVDVTAFRRAARSAVE
jgi:1,4-alpha-glucan branching enzyme